MGQQHSRHQSRARRDTLDNANDSNVPQVDAASDAIDVSHPQTSRMEQEHSTPGAQHSENTVAASVSANTKRSNRRSFLGLGLGPKSTASSSASGSPATSLAKRRWRRSKVPVEVRELGGSRSDDAQDAEPVPVSPASVKGKERSEEGEEDPANDPQRTSPSPASPSTSHAAESTSDVVASGLPQEATHTLHEISPPPMEGIPENQEIVADTVPTDSQPTTPSNVEQNSEQIAPQPSPQRHFPPAGTLVVVQGVVHTTDVPRPQDTSAGTSPASNPPTPAATPTIRRSLSISRPSTPSTPRPSISSGRNRLSALISRSRPTSMLGGRRDSTDMSSSMLSGRRDSTDMASSMIHGHVDSEAEGDSPASSNAGEHSSSAAEGESSATSVSQAVSEREEQIAPPSSSSDPESGSLPPALEPLPAQVPRRTYGGLSPGSIEVLGTLLSVAAAATAASLVTGSSDPLFSFRTGLALPGANGSSTTASTNANASNPTTSPTPSTSTSTPPTQAPVWTAERPTSPTPTSGLGLGLGIGGFGGLPTRPENESERGRRSRVRTSWGGLRDRLGLASGANVSPRGAESESGTAPSSARNSMSAPPTPGFGTGAGLGLAAGSGADTEGQAASTPNADPRERMLREMARALSLGLGIGDRNTPAAAANAEPVQPVGNNESSNAEGSNGGAGTGEGDSTNPPERSFERFLIDLQAELRVALSEGPESEELDPVAEGSGGEADEESAGRRSDGDDELIESLMGPQTRDAGADERRTGEETDRDSLPPLTAVSDSGDEEEEADRSPNAGGNDATNAEQASPASAEDEPNAVQPANTSAAAGPSPMPFAPRTPSNVDGHTTRRPGGGINWWRLYRFPPMPAPASQNGGSAAPVNTSNSSPRAANDSSTSAQSSGTLSAETERDPSLPPFSPGELSAGVPFGPGSTASPPNPNNNANIIVPVIVVGLQSVNTDFGRPHQNHDPDIASRRTSMSSRPGTPAGTDTVDDMTQQTDQGAGASGQNVTRGRPWHTRAVSALRGLRPGRRSSSNVTTQNQSGSRTFLIYVIGGYYPPNHHMVTGTDNLDSFEALLELAELLGQVKPPTATKDEIDKSGLQIIKPCDLERWEKELKVASNCIDRCLICLDDYDAEDDLRVMACKHAFHKNCVDKWLETGRNNCPACRSPGVSTGSDSLNPTPATSTVPPPIV